MRHAEETPAPTIESGPPMPSVGLTSAEAEVRLERYGPNSVPELRPHPLLLLVRRLSGPVPWMLELTLALQLALGKRTDAAVIAALLLLNAVLGFAQESRARSALALLRARLQVQARVRRDGHWQLAPAEILVPGDLIRLRVGDLVPADVRLAEGHVAIDQAALTGESLAAEIGPGGCAYAASVVRRGEATGEVVATGTRTFYGRTAELVHSATATSRLEAVILTIVKYLVAMDGVLVAIVLAYAMLAGIPLVEVLPFALILLVASVPVALPTTFTLAQAIGSLELASRGVLVTRLAAVEEAAAMDVLCSDKTGTITENRLTVTALLPESPHTEEDLLRIAALACDEATQDPIDLAILDATRARGVQVPMSSRLRFVPFDPTTKRSEAFVLQSGATLRLVKGTPPVVAALCPGASDPARAVEQLAAGGARVLAVAAGPEHRLALVGLVGLLDPPRADSSGLVRRLGDLGVRVLMLTGDAEATARTVAAQVGLGNRVAPAELLRHGRVGELLDYDVFAGVYPDDKFFLVQALQRLGHTVGMTGDGVNDAPALRQAEVGIAVANATDVAKAAASAILTNPGLGDIVAAVDVGRHIHQRMLTYTLNKIIKTFHVALFLSLGLLATSVFVTTPHLIVLLLFTNDFVTMALATDRVTPSARPECWNVRSLVASALALATGWLLLSFAVLWAGRKILHLDLSELQTLIFVLLVFSGQATVYIVRERRHLWASAPSTWVAAASVGDVLAVSLMAVFGVLMRPVPASLVAGLLVLVAGSAVALDVLKVRMFRAFRIR